MKSFKKRLTKLSLVAVAVVALVSASQPARANCIQPLYDENGNYGGHVSCGSSAGNYVYYQGQQYGPEAAGFLCLLLCGV